MPLLPVALASVLVIVATWWVDDRGDVGAGGGLVTSDDGASVPGDEGTTTTTLSPFDGWSDPRLAGQPYPGATVDGLLTFRGNPTRSWYGTGPVPRTPEIAFRYPGTGGLCRESTNLGETKVWCGLGWTGQPAVFERDGRTWAVFGAYDGGVHFVDADTGERIIPSLPTGDLIKGSVTVDPDGYPFVYTGSRDDRYRIVSFEGDEPVELWSMHAEDFSPVLWNDDWDSSGVVIDDHLFVGGENSQFVIVRLNRGRSPDGRATVEPEVVFNAPGWDQELLDALGDETVSIEVSPTVVGDTVYFTNSGGLVQGWDVSGLAEGDTPTRTFRFWMGDDTDASIVADAEGMLYVAAEYERTATAARADAVGQLVKLDPSGDDPVVWSWSDDGGRPGGIWGTPAVADGVVYVATNGGRVLGISAATGRELWAKRLPGPLWGSPVVVDDVLLIGDCDGAFHAFDVRPEGAEPVERWSVDLGGCIEATPALWGGRVLVGSRDGALYSIVDGGPSGQGSG